MDEFLLTRFRRKKRYNLKRQIRIALDEQGLVHERVDKQADIERSVADLIALHQKRADEKGIVSKILTDSARSFFQDYCRLALERGCLNLQFLKSNETRVSAVCALEMKDKVFFLQSGIDPEWEKWSVGTVLLTLLIEDAFLGQKVEFDFLKGDEQYKSTWASEARVEFRKVLYRKDWGGRVLYGLHKGLSLVKHSVKVLLGLFGGSSSTHRSPTG